MTVMRRGGKVLRVGGKVATGSACCECGTCNWEFPDPTSVEFSVTVLNILACLTCADGVRIIQSVNGISTTTPWVPADGVWRSALITDLVFWLKYGGSGSGCIPERVVDSGNMDGYVEIQCTDSPGKLAISVIDTDGDILFANNLLLTGFPGSVDNSYVSGDCATLGRQTYDGTATVTL